MPGTREVATGWAGTCVGAAWRATWGVGRATGVWVGCAGCATTAGAVAGAAAAAGVAAGGGLAAGAAAPGAAGVAPAAAGAGAGAAGGASPKTVASLCTPVLTVVIEPANEEALVPKAAILPMTTPGTVAAGAVAAGAAGVTGVGAIFVAVVALAVGFAAVVAFALLTGFLTFTKVPSASSL